MNDRVQELERAATRVLLTSRDDRPRLQEALLALQEVVWPDPATAAQMELAAERERHSAEKDLIFADLSAILRALGLYDGAQPISAHDVVQTVILPEIARLRTP